MQKYIVELGLYIDEQTMTSTRKTMERQSAYKMTSDSM